MRKRKGEEREREILGFSANWETFFCFGFVKLSNKTAQDVTVLLLEWEFLWMDHSRFVVKCWLVIEICAYKLSIRPGFNEIRCAR